MNICFSGLYNRYLIPDKYEQFRASESNGIVHINIDLEPVGRYKLDKSIDLKVVGCWKGFFCYSYKDKYIFSDKDVFTTNEYSVLTLVERDHYNDIIVVSDDVSILSNKILNDVLLYLVQIHALFCDCLIAHSAVITLNENAIAFSGCSGVGKSTQANLWNKYLNATTLNFDKPMFYLDNSHVIAGGTPWSGKEFCFKNQFCKLSAVIFLEKDSSNSIRLLSYAEAFAIMFPNFKPYPIDIQVSGLYEEIVIHLLENAPVYIYKCRNDESSVQYLYNALFDNDYFEVRRKRMIYRINRNYVLRDIAGEHIAILRGSATLEKNTTVIINDTAYFIWNIMINGATEEEIVDRVCKEYNISKIQAEADVVEMIEVLSKKGMLE